MAKKKHPLDVVAEELETLAAKPAEGQDPSPDYWELHSSVANFPQAGLCKPDVVFEWNEEGLGPDGFPTIPIPELRLKGKGVRTDVLSTGLPASWNVGYLFNKPALALFKKFKLGNYREYPATVRDPKGGSHKLTYLLIRNELPMTAIDFARSEFFVADILGIPLQPVAITSATDWVKKLNRAQDGKLNGCEEFSSIDFNRLVIRRDRLPTVDLFCLERLGTEIYVSTRLKKAIEKSGITGLDILPNNKLFAGS